MTLTCTHMNEEIENAIDDMFKKDFIQPSASPWASGIVMVRKKHGTRRFCVDYRKLNDVTTDDSYPTLRIDDSRTVVLCHLVFLLRLELRQVASWS